MNRLVPNECTDPETARKFWTFVTGELAVDDCEERIRLHRHTTQCPACLRALVGRWLLDNLDKIVTTDSVAAEKLS